MPLLTSADYPAVRAAIQADLTAAELPSATLDLPIYAPTAEAWVLGQFPGADTYTEPDLSHAHNAAILYLASLVAPALPDIYREGDFRMFAERSKIDRTKQAATLLSRAVQELNAITVATQSAERTYFTVARGYRGR